VPEPNTSEVEVAIGKLKRCKLPGAEQFKQGGTLYTELCKLIKLI
jgi:hypothetical protein